MPHNIPFILQQTGASRAEVVTTVQSLWSGYGQILRYQLYGSPHQTLIVKFIRPPADSADRRHPRGWQTDLGHQRKLKSYQVETAWYKHWASQCDRYCYVPRCLGVDQQQGTTTLLLEDLDTAGFPLRQDDLDFGTMQPCLDWLAHFHARFMHVQADDLWPTGTYWHLATRPDELAAMTDQELRQAAPGIDRRLNQARFQTLVHGDAKVNNFCFSATGKQVAAVDFQYVGAGCGMKDVAYFMSSCLSETQCEALQDPCLDYYFERLQHALHHYGQRLDFNALELEWRDLFPVAWADFYRFMQGWMPSHRKLNPYSTRLTRQVLQQLQD